MGSESKEHRKDRERSRSPRRKSSKHDDKHRSDKDRSRKDHSDTEEELRKHKRRRERGEDEEDERERRKKEKRKDKEREKHDRKKDRRKDGNLKVVDDDNDDDMWVEKDIDVENAVSTIPTAESLLLKSNASSNPGNATLPPAVAAETPTDSDLRREEWMLDPTQMTIPGLKVQSSTGRVAKSPDLPVPHSANIGESTFGLKNPAARVTAGDDLTDGYGEGSGGGEAPGGGVDFFGSLGTERKRKDPNEGKPDPNKLVISKYELNTQMVEGKSVDEYTPTEKKKIVAGSAGSTWRMMKLRKVYEQASEESRTVEDVAMERYGNLDDFQEAVEERRALDEKESRRSARRGANPDGSNSRSESNASGYGTPGSAAPSRRYVFTTDEGVSSRPSSRAGFRRPGEDGKFDDVGTRRNGSPVPAGASVSTPTARPKGTGKFDTPKSSTPIPSVLTPHHLLKRNPLSSQAVATTGAVDPTDPTASTSPLTASELNVLQAKVLKARLMDDPEADELEAKYNKEAKRSREHAGSGGGDAGNGFWQGSPSGVEGQMGREADGSRTEVQVLPTLDIHGRLYDIGTSSGVDEQKILPGNRKPNLNKKVETRDHKTGDVIRINADDDDLSIGELVRQERFGAGANDQKNLDAALANAIATDARYEADLDYMDDNVEKLARRKMKSDAMKRAFAVNDYAKTKKALDSCPFCYQDDAPPRAQIVAMGHRTYLACTQNEELVDGHCLIVPLQHHLSLLELDDDGWDEIRNFMKCLMQMFAKENKGVLFFETVINLKHQKHSYIEAVPLPANEFADAPAYFRESIMASESEWSQHKKLIDFSARPGGFRRAMVPNLPYFMVHWDYKGEQGYGHVIEGTDDAPGKGMDDEDSGMVHEGDTGGGEFPRYFAQEIIGNMMGLEPRKWRKPRRADPALNQARKAKLGNKFQPFNWTLQLQGQ
ncbi:Pre-mRNA-splicing factor cwf19 [Naganishia albida]|nr:Pre-mRNA-splicing factor cwf19 [Naganishia albida]